MNNKERIEGLLEGLNQVSQNVNRFKTNLKWEFKYVEDKYFENDMVYVKLQILYRDITTDKPIKLLAHHYEDVHNFDSVLEKLRETLYLEFVKQLLFLLPTKYPSRTKDIYSIPIRDLMRDGYDICTQNIDENELRSNTENKE